MNNLQFFKYSANGNDFIIIEEKNISSELVIKLCNRHFGIGADGVLLLSPSSVADINMRIFNADGTEADMCGNGLRCVATYIDKKIAGRKDRYQVETKNAQYDVFKEDGRMKIEMSEKKEVNIYDLNLFLDFTHKFFVNTGVPHLVLLGESIKELDIKELGSFYRYHSIFPKGTNVNFLEIINKDTKIFYVRSYERGVEDETYSCGTGLVACAHALKEWFQMSGEMIFQTKGGNHLIEMNERVIFSGDVQEIFKGEIVL